MHIAIVVSQFNKKISDRLLAGALEGLKACGLAAHDWRTVEVPGAFEIPYMAQRLIDGKKYDGIITLGCVLKGETDHYKAICEGVTYGIQKISIENRIPIAFGVLMCHTPDQALGRSQKIKSRNKGYECATALLEILNVNI